MNLQFAFESISAKIKKERPNGARKNEQHRKTRQSRNTTKNKHIAKTQMQLTHTQKNQRQQKDVVTTPRRLRAEMRARFLWEERVLSGLNQKRKGGGYP